jgi:hypothetical protein
MIYLFHFQLLKVINLKIHGDKFLVVLYRSFLSIIFYVYGGIYRI